MNILTSVCPSIFSLSITNFFRGIHLFHIQLKFDPLSDFKHKISFPMGDEMENSLSTTSIDAQRNGSNWVDPGANTASNLSNQQAPLESSLSPDCNDTKTGPMEVWTPTIAELVLNNSYPVQTAVLSSLDRTDFRNMQLAGLGLEISKAVQRKTLIPIACNAGVDPSWLRAHPYTRLRACTNTTSVMDEIKPFVGLTSWHRFYNDTNDYKYPSRQTCLKSLNVCLECIQWAAEEFPLQIHIPMGRSKICRKHTRENTPLAHHGPCRCFEILAMEWQCLECRETAISEARRRGPQQPLRDFCPVMGCEEVIWSYNCMGELEMCWGCKMIISPSTGNVKW